MNVSVLVLRLPGVASNTHVVIISLLATKTVLILRKIRENKRGAIRECNKLMDILSIVPTPSRNKVLMLVWERPCF